MNDEFEKKGKEEHEEEKKEDNKEKEFEEEKKVAMVTVKQDVNELTEQ